MAGSPKPWLAAASPIPPGSRARGGSIWLRRLGPPARLGRLAPFAVAVSFSVGVGELSPRVAVAAEPAVDRGAAAGAASSSSASAAPNGGSAKPASAGTSKSTTRAVRPSRPADTGTRRGIAGGPTSDDLSLGAETPELRALRAAEQELFPAAPSSFAASAWTGDGAGDTPPVALHGAGPKVLATGLPAASPLGDRDAVAEARGERGSDALSGLDRLDMPDLPVRWDERVLRYLQYFRSDPRGHATFASLYRRSGRYREMMRRALRRKQLPEDLVWVAMIESGFDTSVRSWAGAAGIWQFMPETAKIYGLVIDRWLDQRLDPAIATEAAASFLGDLHQRFGSWELALAAFNMGYVGLASVVHRYNTNDFWSLSRTEGTLPWETTLYVPKVLAAAVVARNLSAFGFGDLTADSPIASEEVSVSGGTPLSLVAQAAGCPIKEIEARNPELRAGRTPPARDGDAAYPVKVPPGKSAAVAQGLARLHRDPPLDRYVVRFGETLEQVAAAHKTTAQRLVELNAIAPAETIRGGTVLLVPHLDGPRVDSPGAATGPAASSTPPAARPSVVVPPDVYVYPDRRRVFYRVLPGDSLEEIARALRVPAEDLCRWNDVDPSARLQEGMTLQAFVPESADLSTVFVTGENEVHVLPVGSDEFFAAVERDRGFRRVTVSARAGDTIESIGRRYQVSARTMERINRRSRRDALKDGEPVVVYVPLPDAAKGELKSRAGAESVASDALPGGPFRPAAVAEPPNALRNAWPEPFADDLDPLPPVGPRALANSRGRATK